MLYPFQRSVVDALQSGRNVILAAPTGAGKTWAALLHFLQQRVQRRYTYDRILYALPLRTLANSLYQSTIEVCSKALRVLTGASEGIADPLVSVTIQTGARPEDPFFQGDICFTTIDQLLSAYLNIPVSLPTKLSNINAGALLGALVVVDEIHLLETKRALSTLLELSRRMKGLTQFLWMTATMPTETQTTLAESLQADIITPTLGELAEMPSHKDKHREYRWVGKEMEAADILRQHEKRTIVVCNTVSRAQELFSQLRREVPKSVELLLLHSRFYQSDRESTERKLADLFGPDAKAGNAILVTTQVIEAGIDISADVLHSELAAANTVVQRAGRCARYPIPRNIGTVWVYELRKNEHGDPRLGPYREAPLPDQIKRTRESLLELSGKCLSFPEEQSLVNQVHANAERESLCGVFRDLHSRKEMVNKAIEIGNAAALRELIRDVDSINILLSDQPIIIDWNAPPELLSIPRTSLFSLKSLLREVSVGGIAISRYVEGNEEESQSGHWVSVNTFEELLDSWLIRCGSRVASYSAELGLNLSQPGPIPPLRTGPSVAMEPPCYRLEMFGDHAHDVVACAMAQCDHSPRGVSKVAELLDLVPESINRLMEVIALLHDAGKLSTRWQQAASDWQQYAYPAEDWDRSQALAHTTFLPGNGDHQRQRNARFSRGPHAPEGAYLVSGLIYNLLQTKIASISAQFLTRISLTAIARHHGGRVADLSDFRLDRRAEWELERLLHPVFPAGQPLILLSPPGERERDQFKDRLLHATREEEEKLVIAYWFIVRCLRLADQKATRTSAREVMD